MARVGTAYLDVVLDAQKAGQELSAFGRRFTTDVSAPLGAVEALAVKTFASFESSLARVTGLSGVSREQVQGWSGDIKQLGVDYAVGAQAAADATYFVSSSGIAASKTLGVVRESSKASAAGLGETKTIADLTTSALNAYSGTNLTAARATDILTAAVASGKGEPAEFAESLGQVLPIASALGVSYEQVAGAESAMTLRGLDASEATTALRGIFTTLLKPTQQAEEALASVGLSSADLRKQLKEQGLLSTLETLTGALGNDAAAASVVFENVRALNGVMNILGENTNETRRVMDEVANSTGATDKAFESASQTTEFKMNQALAKMKVALIDVGGQIAPVATAIGGFASGAAEQFGRLPQPLQTTTLAAAGLLTAIGPAAFVVGKITAGFAGAAVSTYNFAAALTAANAGLVTSGTTGIARLGVFLGKIPFQAAAAGAGIIALAGAYAILQSKISDAKDDGTSLQKIGDATVRNAKSFDDLQQFIAKANGQTAELQKRFDEVKFDPSEREQIGAMGEALAKSAEQASKFSGQAIRISEAMGVSKDQATQWIIEQANLGHTFDSADLALAQYRASVAQTTTATGEATTATGKLAAAAGPLSEPFFALQTAQRGYESSLRGVATAQRQVDAAARGVTDAQRGYDTALRQVSNAEERRRQSLRSVEEAQRGVTEAQKALNDALRGPSEDQQLNVESAELAVARARQRLTEIGKTKPGEKVEALDPLDRREAQLSLRRAENDLQRARAEVDGRVTIAQDNLRAAQDKLTSSQQSADDAAQAVADAHVAVGSAMQGIVDARQAAEDATIAVRDAQWQANDAARNLAGSQDAFNGALSKAPGLAGPFIGYLEQLRDRFPEVAGGLQANIDKLRELQALAPVASSGLPNSQSAPFDQPVGGDDAPYQFGGPPRPASDRYPGRAYGGPVFGGLPYEVTELGVPELYSDGARQWMIPPVDGEVVAMSSTGGSGGPSLVIEHLDVHGPDPVATSSRMITDMSRLATLARAR